MVCGNGYNVMPNAHYIPRAQGGLGVEENVVTLCIRCHNAYDNSPQRGILGREIRDYLKSQYPAWDENKLIYRKGEP